MRLQETTILNIFRGWMLGTTALQRLCQHRRQQEVGLLLLSVYSVLNYIVVFVRSWISNRSRLSIFKFKLSIVYLLGLAVGGNIPAGGTWIVGNEEVNDAINSAAPFKGEITNVNIYGNFEKIEFQTDVAYRVTSKTCRPSIYKNIIKSWNDFKIGFVGDLKVLSKNFCTWYGYVVVYCQL